LRALVLAYGAGTMVSQVLILRELMVLVQGQELKLALGLWCWLMWTGLGSLLGGSLGGRSKIAGESVLGGLLALLGLLLPATVLAIRLLPAVTPLGGGQSLSLATTLWLFLLVLAPFGLASGYFFPCASRVLAGAAPLPDRGAPGRVYYLDTLGAALGVLVLQFLLLGYFPGLGLCLATGLLLALGPWLLIPPRHLVGRLAGAVIVLVLGLGLVLLPRLEALSRSWQWPGRQVLATAESPYALLAATREAEQVSFFANHLWQFTYPDPFTAEHQVQLALLSHPRPRQVLLLGGGPGLLPEILKTPAVTRLDYVELDPQLVRLALKLLPEAGAAARDPRVRLVFQDARRFLGTTGERYDVILMALPEPRNAQLNRFYSQEFFGLAAGRLVPGGVFSFALTGAETSLHPLRAAYLAMTYYTLARVFPEVQVLPGDRARFLAAAAPGFLAADPETLVRRIAERHLKLQYVREYYLMDDLSRPRREYLRQVLARFPEEVNRDLKPGCYFYDLALSAVQEGLPDNRVFLALKGLPPYLPWGGPFLALILLGVVIRGRPRAQVLLQVTVMGLGAMALEVLVLILYQLQFGCLYRQLGLLIAAFMVGMAAGSAAGAHWAERCAAGARGLTGLLRGLQGGLAGLAALLGLWLAFGPAYPWPEFLTQAAYVVILALGGSAGGGIFALGAALWHRDENSSDAGAVAAAGGTAGGFLYAADLLGATLGTLGVSLLVLPVWGIMPALGLIASVHAGAALLLLFSGAVTP
jgi:spermidine synthase